MEFSGSGPGKDDAAVEQMLLDNLLPALLQTCALITVGYYAKKNNLLPAGASTTLGSFAAILALPALCFLSMAQLDLGNANLGVPLGMLVAKVSVAGLVGLLTVTLIRPSKKEERTRSLSALFALLTVSSNDYALGLPIIDALYPASLPPSYERGDAKPWPAGEGGKVMDEFKMSDYIWLMSPITLLIINPVIFAILGPSEPTILHQSPLALHASVPAAATSPALDRHSSAFLASVPARRARRGGGTPSPWFGRHDWRRPHRLLLHPEASAAADAGQPDRVLRRARAGRQPQRRGAAWVLCGQPRNAWRELLINLADLPWYEHGPRPATGGHCEQSAGDGRH